MMKQRIRLLLSRDDYYHQRGYWVLASAFKDAGVEVILGGIQTPEDIIQTAIQEDVDIIGYRIMDADPKILIQLLFDKMNERDAVDIPVVVGGIIPEKDEVFIKKLGVKEVFHPYSPLEDVVDRVTTIAMEAGEGRKSKE